MWKTKEAKCVIDPSQSINDIKGVGESKHIYGIIVFICPYLFLYIINTLDFYKLKKKNSITFTMLIGFKRN